MHAKPPRILVTGATGRVGQAVALRLAGIKDIELVVGVRSPKKAEPLQAAAVTLDYERPETIAPALEGVDRLFLVTGYSVDMLRQSKTMIDAARKARVSHIVHLGAPGADDTQVAHYGWHQFVERYIEWSGISFTHLRPEIFMQNLLGYGGVPIVRQGVIRQYIGAASQTWVDGEDVAAVAAACLRYPATHAGQTYRLGYDARTYFEIADILTRIVGQPFAYEPRPPGEFLQGALSAGADPAYMDCVYRNYSNLASGRAAGSTEIFENFAALTGGAPSRIEDFVARHRDYFRY